MFIVAIVICNYRKSIIRAQYYVFMHVQFQRNSCAIIRTEEYEKKK